MSVIRLDLYGPVMDGDSTAFRAPCACSSVTGLKVYYPDGETTKSISFTLVDANGQSITNAKSAFCSGALVTVVFDVTNGKAYIQNADTNAYLEGKFSGMVKSLSDLGVNASAAELNHMKGVTSEVQGQLDGKAPSNHNHDGVYAPNQHSHAYLPTANVVNNLTTTGAGYALDARQGKALSDKLNTVSTGSISTSYAHSLVIKKYGRIVTISGYIQFNSQGLHTVGTIASGFRPIAELTSIDIGRNPVSTNLRYGQGYKITTDGVLSAYADSADKFYIHTVYICS